MADVNNTNAVNNTKNNNNRRFALIVATSDYKEDPDLRKLIAPAQDAEALYSVLNDPEIGGFEQVKIIKNERSYKISEEIQEFLNERRPDDMLLLYFSCHGIKDEEGQLYFAATNTRRTILDSTAISADFINRVMFRSRSRRQILVLDCCYSGAFARGLLPRADKTIHTNEYFDQGRGRIVLTASDAMQYSFEENTLRVEVTNPGSIYTRAIVDGLKTGKADLNQDGHVSYDELYEYTYDRVIRDTPFQKPGMWVLGVQGDVVIAKNPHKKTVVEGGTSREPNADELIQDAVESLKRGEYNNTIEYSDKAIKINPSFALAYNIKGQALFNLKNYQEALSCYEKALELRPKYIEAINYKGLVLAEMGEYSKAIECFSQSIDLNRTDASIWNYKGLAFHALEKYKQAIESFDTAISLNPSYTEAKNNKESSTNELNKKTPKQEPGRSGPPIINIQERKGGGIYDDTPIDGGYSSIQESKNTQGSDLKILIPVVAAVIGIVIAVVVIFGSGMMHQQSQPSAPSNVNSSLTAPRPPASVTPPPPAATSTTNIPPTATNQSVSTNQNTPIDITLTGNDPDKNDTLTAAIVTNPSHGTLTGINQQTGVVTYIPDQDFTGDDSFTFKVNDGKADSSNTGIVNIRVNLASPPPPTSQNTNATTPSNVNPPTTTPPPPPITTSPPTAATTTTNTPPTVTDQSVTTSQNTPIDITLSGSDPDKNDTLTAAIVTNPSHGTLSSIDQNTGVVTYTPNSGFIGDDSFTFKVNDGKVNSRNTGIVNIKVG
jgi:tetratricopeptide (TPR) repeat protein